MEDLIKLFDSLLITLVSFPITIFLVIFTPEEAVGPMKNHLVNPPGATLVVSFFIWYAANSLRLKIEYDLPNLPIAPAKALSVGIVVLIGLVLDVQYLILHIPSMIPALPDDPVATVKVFSYPVSAAMTTYGIVYFAYIGCPIGSRVDGRSFREVLDPIVRRARKDNKRKRIVIADNAYLIAFISASLVYIWVLFNTVKILFDLPLKQALVSACALVFGTFLLIMLFGFVLPSTFGGIVGRLKQQAKPIPDGEKREDGQ